MSIATFEGIVDKGQIKLTTKVNLPDNTKVYVIVPDFQIEHIAHITSPRLLHREQATAFEMEVVEELSDGGL